MLSLISGTIEYIFKKPERRLIFLGLDNAGKTTSLEQVKINFGQKNIDLSKIIPTIGLNVGKIEVEGVDCLIWDLGGHRNFRIIWKNYFAETQAIAFILDSCDTDRINEAKDVLFEVIENDCFKNTALPIAIFCNKSDRNDALTLQEIEERLDLDSIKKIRAESNSEVAVFKVSALKNLGMKEAVKWLVGSSMKKKELEYRSSVRLAVDTTDNGPGPQAPVEKVDTKASSTSDSSATAMLSTRKELTIKT